MTCAHCQLESAVDSDLPEACGCAAEAVAAATESGPESGLEGPTEDWQAEVRRRADSYRRRRALRSASAELDLASHAASHAVIPFPRPFLRRPVRRRPDGPPEEPLADPVVAPPRARQPEAASPLPPRAPEPVPLAPPLDFPPEWQPRPECNLAEPVHRPPPERRLVQPQSLLTLADPAGFLHIPLPIAANPPTAGGATAVEGEEAREFPVAPQRQRLLAGLVDSLVVGLASALFAGAAWAGNHFAPPDAHTLRHLLPALVATPGLLAAALILFCFTCAGATPGMRAARLHLAGCDGPVTAAARRRRAWASLLSLAALGLGFAWIFCDPQQLTWHDSISRTFLALDAERRD